jgi:hypothetical protein
MSEPIQFSMRRMFYAVTWLCIALGSFAAFIRLRDAGAPECGLTMIVVAFAAAGAGVGVVIGRPLRWALCAAGLATAFLSMCFLATKLLPGLD